MFLVGAMLGGVEACEHRGVRWQRPMGNGDRVLVHDRILREFLEEGSCLSFISVQRQVVASEGVEHDNEDMGPRLRLPERF